MKELIAIWWLGVREGFASPFDLGCGMSYEYQDGSPDMRRTNAYDHGANLGQFIGRIVHKP